MPEQPSFDQELIRLKNLQISILMSNNITPRELQIAELISFGKTEKEMGNCLHLSVDTVKSHKRNLFTKTHSRNIADVTRWYFSRKSGYVIKPSAFFITASIVSVAAVYILMPHAFSRIGEVISMLTTSLQSLLK